MYALVERATRCRQALLLLLTLNSWWGGTTLSNSSTAITEVNVLDVGVRDKFEKHPGMLNFANLYTIRRCLDNFGLPVLYSLGL
jgi:hypothetical protein